MSPDLQIVCHTKPFENSIQSNKQLQLVCRNEKDTTRTARLFQSGSHGWETRSEKTLCQEEDNSSTYQTVKTRLSARNRPMTAGPSRA